MQQAGAGLVEVGTGGVLPPGQVQVLGHGILTVFNYPAATSATYHCPSSPRTQSLDTSSPYTAVMGNFTRKNHPSIDIKISNLMADRHQIVCKSVNKLYHTRVWYQSLCCSRARHLVSAHN